MPIALSGHKKCQYIIFLRDYHLENETWGHLVMIIFPVEFQYADAYITFLTTCLLANIDLLCSNNGIGISPKILGISSSSLNTIIYQGHSAQEVKSQLCLEYNHYK